MEEETGHIKPIAVVGFSFGFPQDATSSEAFWDMLLNRKNTNTPIPPQRMSATAMYSPDASRRGQMAVQSGHFLTQDLAAFDAPFFSISPSDCAAMDPQQRGLLEYTYKALENAGLPMEKVTGSKTSVYTGCFTNDWQHISFKDSEQCETTTALGIQPCVNANRISWFFNLKGTSANIDTACSSSLVALDLGCKGLMYGDTEMSIVTGSNIIFSPDTMHALTNMSMLSPTGQSYSFDHRANGYARGEGIGVVVLKRLSDAIRDNDTIRGIIRNTGCNQDGYTPGITQPNPESQEALIRETYLRAGLSMEPTRFFEAHGTGTPVGDPIESSAIGAAFRKVRTEDDPLYVGAVKSNIGHLEGASGIAGLIKTILVLEKGVIPPNTNFEKLNPKIDTEFLRIKLPLESTPWPTAGSRRAAVNSFGFGGTNAFVILDDVYHYLHTRGLSGNHVTVRDPPTLSVVNHSLVNAADLKQINGHVNGQSNGHSNEDLNGHSNRHSNGHSNGIDDAPLSPKILILSANDKDGIKRQATSYTDHFNNPSLPAQEIPTYLSNLAYTLSNRRTSLPWKSFAIASNLSDLQTIGTSLSPPVKSIADPSLGFIFTGQGAQWAGMGRDLLKYNIFERSLCDAEEYLQSLGCTWLLREQILKDAKVSNINSPEFSQPVCTVVQVALLDLLSTFGIYPTAVVGHSSGEIAAAYSLGAISARAAWKIAYYRGISAADLSKSSANTKGAMASVGLSPSQVAPYIESVAQDFGSIGLTVACINSHKNVTISGDENQIEALKAMLDKESIFVRKLLVDVAYHSPHMQAVAPGYRKLIAEIEKGTDPAKPVTMISSVTGQRVSKNELASPDYWVSNLVSPVRFSDAVNQLCARSTQRIRKKLDLSHRSQFHINMLVEIGPHPALQGPVRDILTELPGTADIGYCALLERKKGAVESFLTGIGRMKCLGCPIDLEMINHLNTGGYDKCMVLPDLPEYPFDHSKTYWYESRISKRFRTHPQGKLDLLGKPVPDWNPLEAKWRNVIRTAEIPWVEDHVINGAMVYPGAGMLVMAIEAANQMADPTQNIVGFELKDTLFLRSLTIPPDAAGIETQLSLHLQQETLNTSNVWSEFRLCAFENEKWHECCRGSVRIEYERQQSEIDGGKEDQEELLAHQSLEKTMQISCNQPMDPAQLYQSLINSGFGFGPSFQPITNGSFSDNNDSKADIRLYEWPENEYPQPHIVHPTSLDGMLHLAIAGYAKGGQKPPPTMIPTMLKNLWISKTGLSYPENASVKACAWLVAQDNRGTEWDASVLDPTKHRVLARIRGLKLTIIGEGATEEDSSMPDRQVCYRIEQLPDPDLLSPEQISEYCQIGAEASKLDESHVLARYLDILAHKNPSLRILHLGAGNGVSIEKMLDVLSKVKEDGERQSPRCSSYHYTDPSQSVSEEVRKSLEKYPFVTFGPLGAQEEENGQKHEMENYDLIIASDLSFSNIALANLPLSPGGKFLAIGKNGSVEADGGTSWPKGFADESLSITSVSLSNDRVLFIAAPGTAFAAPPEPKQIVIVLDESSDLQLRAASSLSSLLISRTNHSCSSLSLPDASALANKISILFVVILELDQELLYHLSSSDYSILQRFLITAKDILWVNPFGGSQPGKPAFAMANGLARALRNEYEDHRISNLGLDISSELSASQVQKIANVLERNHFDDDRTGREWEFIEVEGKLNIQRVEESKKLGEEIHIHSLPKVSTIQPVKNTPPVYLSIGSPGLLDTLHFTEDPIFENPLAEDDIEIQTQAIGMNFKDCLVALGQVPSLTLGLECSGIVTRVGSSVSSLVSGDRILMAAPGSFRTFTRGKISGTCKIPSSMSFIEAAAIPAQFGTAWEVIHENARLKRGETILIHAAAGGTGQAAIQIAQYLGGEVFATVGSEAKRKILVEEYHIPSDHIFYSRDTSFAKGVKRMTRGRGVDVIINSLAGESLLASWECIASYGRFVEIGKKDIMANAQLPMAVFAKNAAFIGFDASTWQQEKPLQAQRDLQLLVELFANGTFHTPRPLHVYDIAETEEVFRLMRDGKTAGKIVLEVRAESMIPTTLQTKPSFLLDPNAAYVIAGGLGGLGRSIARWMVQRNAKHLILLSRSGPRTELAMSFLQELSEQGIHVATPTCDVSDMQAMKVTFEKLAQKMPPIKGCIQGSMVRRDELFELMGYESWKVAVECKTLGSWNLHTLLPEAMDFFVLLSSASGVVGLRGQTNYAAGNTFEDAIARYRVSHSQKAISLDLGAMIDDGLLAETPELLNQVLAYGTLNPVSRSQFYSILDHYCNPQRPVSAPDDSQSIIGLGVGGGSGLDGVDLSLRPIFRRMAAVGLKDEKDPNSSASNDNANYEAWIVGSTSLDEAGNIVIQALVQKLSKSLSLDSDVEVDINKPLHAYGVDSLLAVELRNWISRGFGADVAVFEMLGGETFETVGRLVAGRSRFKHPGWSSA